MSGWFDDGTEENSEAEAHAEPPHSAPHGDSGHDRGHDRGAESDAPGGDPESDQKSGSARERYRVKGDDLLAKVKQLVHEGNVRKITIRNEEDRVLLSFPLAAGVLGAALLPVWAGVGAVAALVGNCSIDVERRE